jgi:hypothetical protein
MRLRNLIPAAFVVIHWVLYAVALAWRGHSFPFHLVYEPLLLQILWIADLPALLVLLAFGIEVKLSLADSSWWELALTMIGISVQWLIMGIMVSRFLRNRKSSEKLD